MRVATNSLYQPRRAPSLRSGLSKAAKPMARAGVWATVLNMLGTTPRCCSRASYNTPSSGGTWSRSSIGMRPWASFSATLKGPAQRELDETRRAHGGKYLAERIIGIARIGKIGFDVGNRRVAEVRVVPDIKEVGGEAHRLPFRQAEFLQERKVPVLLEWPTINVPPQIAEVGGAEVVIAGALSGIKQRRTGEVGRVQIAVNALVNVAAGVTGGDIH